MDTGNLFSSGEYNLASNADLEAMSRALSAAAQQTGATAPNPSVGCVLLDVEGNLLAEGFHQKSGAAHAEAAAIIQARVRGMVKRIHTVVVTLEPCNHHGRTPPCVEAILATPARRVVIGVADPNPSVAGGGADRLAAGGLDVIFLKDLKGERSATLEQRAARMIAPFAKRTVSGIPWVTVKQAFDANGSMVPPLGQKTFTSKVGLTLAHRLRRRADAVITGAGTILADSPEFTVRHVADFPGKQRFLIILDRRCRVPLQYIRDAERRGFEVLKAETIEGALQQLGAAGALEVLVEAGPQLSGSVLNDKLWDEHVVITRNGGTSDHIEVFYQDHKFHDLKEAIFSLGEER